MKDNPLVGQFDTGTVALVKDALSQALRPIRVRLINRIGVDVPMRLVRCDFVQLGALQERLYEEQVRLLSRVRLSESGISFMFGLDTPLLFRMVGLLMGEDPWAEPAAVDSRPLTPTDTRVARRLLEDLIGGLQEGLPRGVRDELIIDNVSDEPRMELGLPPSAGMFDIAIEVGDAENPLGTAVMGLPTSVVPAWFPEASTRIAPKESKAGLARVLPLRVEAIAELGRIRMPLSRLDQFAVGDTLNLGRIRQIEVRVRDRVALIGEAGAVDGMRCIRVLRNVHDLGASS